MKRILACLLALVCLAASWAFAEERTFTFHSVFGLKEGAGPDEISTAIRGAFSTVPSEGGHFYPVNKYFYDFPVRQIELETSDSYGTYRSFEITLEENSLTAENLLLLYRQFSGEFGDPEICVLEKEVITVRGKEKVRLSPDDPEEIQKAMDQYNFYGLICWGNITLTANAYATGASAAGSREFRLEAAYSRYSLRREIREYYGLPLE